MFMPTFVALVLMTAPIFRPRRAGTSSIPTNPGR
jgi:cell shape-determining protein MreD